LADARIQQLFQSGIQHLQAGRLREAEAVFREILAQEPNHVDALHVLGVIEGQAGRFDSAIELIRRSIELRPENAEALSNLGVALSDRGLLDEAIAAFRQAIRLKPALFDAHNNLGNCLREKKQFDEAIAELHEALRLNPRSAQAFNNLGNVFHDKKLNPEAIGAFRQAIRLNPAYAEAHNNLSLVLRSAGSLEEATAACHEAIRLRPRFAEAYNTLANVLCDKNLFDEAMNACGRSLELKADYSDAHFTLGRIFRGKKMFDEAADALRRAIALKPNFAQAYDNLGNVLADQGLLDEAVDCYDRAVALAPDNPVPAENRIYSLLFHPGYDAGAILREHLKFDELHSGPLRSFIRAHSNNRDPDRRLRIGYVSPDFKNHCQSFFMMPLLSSHDHERFEIYCYSSVGAADAITDRMRPLADVWRDVVGQSDAQLAETIRADGIDILVDLTMHMAHGRPQTFARKPAPIQVAWLAYPGTTGLSAIDYRLTDPYLDPPGENDQDYSEKSIRLPDTFWCFDPLVDDLEVNALPSLEKGAVTFGCLNNFSKVNEQVLALWAKVLLAVGNSQLLLMAPQGSARRRTLETLDSCNVESRRIQFVAYQPRLKYLETYRRIDIGLDTFPYNGHTTTLDSLWMGVPVVSLIGRTVVGRAGYSQLSNIGLQELAVKTPEQFVEKAIELAGDGARLSQLRSTLRQRLQQSPLMDAPRFARNIESAYVEMWRNWVGAVAKSSKTPPP
jgi:protein O-GlcNAc transferase